MVKPHMIIIDIIVINHIKTISASFIESRNMMESRLFKDNGAIIKQDVILWKREITPLSSVKVGKAV